jgi:hypothetical protein
MQVGILTNPSCTLGSPVALVALAGSLAGCQNKNKKKRMQAILVIGLTRSWSARDEQG